MFKKIAAVAMVAAFAAMTANADTFAEYDSGVTATAGATGAADPTTQGWTASPGVGANAWTSNLDSGNGGWRVIDGTSTANSYYQAGLDAGQTWAIGNADWTVDFTFSSNADLIRAGQTLDDWVVSNSKFDTALWMEQAGGFRYILTVMDNGSGGVAISDGTSTFDIGHSHSQEVGTGSVALDFATLTLSYDAGTGTATLSESSTVFGTVASTGSGGGSSRLIFGSPSGPGMGSTTWNHVELTSTIPEPATLGLFAVFGGSVLVIRRKLMM